LLLLLTFHPLFQFWLWTNKNPVGLSPGRVNDGAPVSDWRYGPAAI
jgi:hypothetical protein